MKNWHIALDYQEAAFRSLQWNTDNQSYVKYRRFILSRSLNFDNFHISFFLKPLRDPSFAATKTYPTAIPCNVFTTEQLLSSWISALQEC